MHVAINVSLRGGGFQAIALHVLVGHAPDGPAGCSKEKFLDGHAKNVDSKKIRDVVIALDKAGVEEEKNQEQRKIQKGEMSEPVIIVGIKSERRTAITAAPIAKAMMVL